LISIFGSRRSNGSVSTCSCSISDLLLLFSWLKNLETAHQSIVNAHHSAGIVEFTAIVGSGEKSYKLSLSEKLIAVFYYLMSPADQVEIMLFVKS
jgi:hypothetical protein